MTEPQRVLQYFSWEDQERWQVTTPEARLEWLEFVIAAAWAGAAQRRRTERLSGH
jgi:hypothetical protein